MSSKLNSAVDFLYSCQLNKENNQVECTCKSGDCTALNYTQQNFEIDNTYDKSTVNDFGIALWKKGTISSFAYFDIDGSKKFDFGYDGKRSNDGTCSQLVGCTGAMKSKQDRELCQGKMKEKCADFLSEQTEKYGGNDALETTYIPQVLPFVSDESDSTVDSFVNSSCLGAVIEKDGLNLADNMFENIGLCQAENDSSKSLRRNLQSSTFSSDIENDSNATVPDDATPDDEIVVNGSTSTKTLTASEMTTKMEEEASVVVENENVSLDGNSIVSDPVKKDLKSIRLTISYIVISLFALILF